MSDFEIPDLNVVSVMSVDTTYTSGDELPFIPFSTNEDELGFVPFS